MAAASGGSSSMASLPAPRPKSPPQYPDLYGKRRELAKVQMLEREIGFLEEELKFVQGLQPASRSCKEVADFVVASVDPLLPASRKIRRTCRFWKWLRKACCCNFSWICCFECVPNLQMPHCCTCNLHNCCHSCFGCSIPKCPKCPSCYSWPSSRCFAKIWCSSNCCVPQSPSCPDCSCRWKCSCPKCPKVNLSSCCTKNSCYPCSLCY